MYLPATAGSSGPHSRAGQHHGEGFVAEHGDDEIAAAVVVVCTLGTPARAHELAQNLGPGPYEPILTTVGSKRVIAFYEPDNGRCAVHAVVFDKTDAYTGMTTAARVRVSLNPREMVHIDSADNESVKSLNLQCGKNAEKLTNQPPSQPIKASASGF